MSFWWEIRTNSSLIGGNGQARASAIKSTTQLPAGAKKVIANVKALFLLVTALDTLSEQSTGSCERIALQRSKLRNRRCALLLLRFVSKRPTYSYNTHCLPKSSLPAGYTTTNERQRYIVGVKSHIPNSVQWIGRSCHSPAWRE